MPEYRVTFGSQYRSPDFGGEAHPVGGHEFVHADGWWAVVAPDEDAARELVVAVLGTKWSHLYADPETADWPQLFPRGQMLRLVHPAMREQAVHLLVGAVPGITVVDGAEDVPATGRLLVTVWGNGTGEVAWNESVVAGEGVSIGQAADLLYAAAELLTEAPPPVDELEPDEATFLLARIRDAVALANTIDSLLCARLVRDRWGELDVEGLGRVKYRRTAKRERWDERGAAFAVVAAKMEERGGVVPDDPGEVVDWLLEAASIGYFRKTALRSMGIDVGDYWHAEKGNPAVDLPKR